MEGGDQTFVNAHGKRDRADVNVSAIRRPILKCQSVSRFCDPYREFGSLREFAAILNRPKRLPYIACDPVPAESSANSVYTAQKPPGRHFMNRPDTICSNSLKSGKPFRKKLCFTVAFVRRHVMTKLLAQRFIISDRTGHLDGCSWLSRSAALP